VEEIDAFGFCVALVWFCFACRFACRLASCLPAGMPVMFCLVVSGIWVVRVVTDDNVVVVGVVFGITALTGPCVVVYVSAVVLVVDGSVVVVISSVDAVVVVVDGVGSVVVVLACVDVVLSVVVVVEVVDSVVAVVVIVVLFVLDVTDALVCIVVVVISSAVITDFVVAGREVGTAIGIVTVTVV
jgi:hypothetical protein